MIQLHHPFLFQNRTTQPNQFLISLSPKFSLLLASEVIKVILHYSDLMKIDLQLGFYQLKLSHFSQKYLGVYYN